MITVAGIDPSVTSTGIAWPDGTTTTLAPPSKLRGGERLDHIERQLTTQLRHHPPLPRVVILEGYSPHSPSPWTTLKLGEVGGIVRMVLHRAGVTVVEVEPKRLKRYATGNGNADKPAMRAALPDTVDATCANDDEVDAWWLRHIGRCAYGLDTMPTEAHRLDVLSLIDWPRITP